MLCNNENGPKSITGAITKFVAFLKKRKSVIIVKLALFLEKRILPRLNPSINRFQIEVVYYPRT